MELGSVQLGSVSFYRQLDKLSVSTRITFANWCIFTFQFEFAPGEKEHIDSYGSFY